MWRRWCFWVEGGHIRKRTRFMQSIWSRTKYDSFKELKQLILYSRSVKSRIEMAAELTGFHMCLALPIVGWLDLWDLWWMDWIRCGGGGEEEESKTKDNETKDIDVLKREVINSHILFSWQEHITLYLCQIKLISSQLNLFRWTVHLLKFHRTF